MKRIQSDVFNARPANVQVIAIVFRYPFLISLVLASCLLTRCVSAASNDSSFKQMTDRLWSDQKEFYSPQGLFNLGLTAGTAAFMANTDIDENLHDYYQDHWGNANALTSASGFIKEFGDGRLVIPAMIAGNLVAQTCFEDGSDSWLGEFSERSLRAYLVGAAPLLLAQRVGGSRPQERQGVTTSSPWVIGSDTNAASGHAFIGAVPFLTAAKMTDSQPAKWLYYALSTLPAWSRVHDSAHYPSQSLLGWGLANLSVNAVNRTESKHNWTLSLTPIHNGAYLSLGWEF